MEHVETQNLVANQSIPQSIEIFTHPTIDTRWLKYFNRRAAIESVFAHIATLPSSRTPEQHTLSVYKAGLENFLAFAGDALPTEDLLYRYIAALKLGHAAPSGKSLASSTISSKYLAPARLYLSKLAGQHIAVTGDERDFVQDAREAIRAASTIKTPKSDTSSNLPPLWQHGNRLTLQQVNQLYATCDINTLAGRRDLAFLYLSFTSALRIAEIQRLSLSKIKQGKDGWELHVRGKRNNLDPVPLDNTAYQLILDWVDSYNARLDAGDPRIIGDDSALWQPLMHNDSAFPYGYQGIENLRGITDQGLRNILEKRCKQIRLYDRSFPIIAPHDMRRTVAALGYSAGMDYTQLQILLRHKNLSTTFGYVGKAPDLSKSKLSTYVNFTLPQRAS